MPVYTFEKESGETTELFFNMDDAPRIGTTIEIAGIKLTRLVDPIQVDCRQDVHFTAHQISRWHPDAPALNERGQPVFSSKRQVDEFVAKTEGAAVWE